MRPRGGLYSEQSTMLCSQDCVPSGTTALCAGRGHTLWCVCVCVRLVSPFPPLPQPASKFSFDALSAPRVPASDCRRVSCSLSSCPPAGSLAASAPGQVDLSPRARRCVLTAADTGAVATEKFTETFSWFFEICSARLGRETV